MVSQDLLAFADAINRIISGLIRENPFFLFHSGEGSKPIIPFLHQVEFIIRVMFRRPIRVLLADEIGLGKTISALMILKLLNNKKEIHRILILVPRILVNQWFFEIARAGFGYPRRIERDTIDTLYREGFPDGVYLASMDLVKLEKYFNKIRDVPWDVIIVDEAHRLGAKKKEITQRYLNLGTILMEKFPERNILLLSATPHRGDAYDYISRLRLVDPFLESPDVLDRVDFYARTINVIVFRRTKIDVNEVYERRKVFTDCKLEAIIVRATDDEIEFHEKLIDFIRNKLLEFYAETQRPPKALGLLMALIFKRASSSPAAAISTMERIIAKRDKLIAFKKGLISLDELLERLDRESSFLANSIFGIGFEDISDYELYNGRMHDIDDALNKFAEDCSTFLSDEDIRRLKELILLAKKISQNDSRLKALLKLIDMYMQEDRKIVVFTEYKDTVSYIERAIKDIYGAKSYVVVTGDTVSRSDNFRKIKERFESDPECRIMIATDVASEGLNLQVASIVINYEPPWSPIKLEQRMGRVWRLGQQRDVRIHNIFLTVSSDKDVLDVLYKKLIAMGRAYNMKKIPIGEDVLIIDFTKEEPILMPITIRDKKKKVKITEYKLISEYLREGREGLERLVKKMIRAIEILKRNLERFNLISKLNPHDITRTVGDITGFSDYKTFSQSLKLFVDTLLDFYSKSGLVRIHKSRNKKALVTDTGSYIPLDDTSSAISILQYILSKTKPSAQKYIFGVVSNFHGVLIVASAKVLLDGKNIYEQPIGVLVDREKMSSIILHGAHLFNQLSELLREGSPFIIDEYLDNSLKMDIIYVKSKIKEFMDNAVKRVLRDYNHYLQHLINRQYRIPDSVWLPKLNYSGIKIEISEPILTILFIKATSTLKAPEIDPKTKEIVEETAMKIALEHERKMGRQPKRVDNIESYDIYSIDPKTKEKRYIEVKGHSKPLFIAELTEKEYELAKTLKDKYWLYIVQNIAQKPILLAIRNPLEKLKIEIKEEIVKRKKYILKP